MRSVLIIIILCTGIFLVFNSAFAVDPNDSSPWQTVKTYAATTVQANCTNYGGDPNGDGICANWKTSTGLQIDFTDSSIGGTAVHYRYVLLCNTHATIVANPSDPQNVVDPTGNTVCPSISKKDIYLELDWMSGQSPDPKAIADVVKAFDNQGIALHIQYGENPSTNSGNIGVHYCDVRPTVLRNVPTTNNGNLACSSTTTNYQGYPYLKQNFFGTADERNNPSSASCPNNAVPSGVSVSNPNSYNCLTAKRQVFHYAMLVDHQWGSPTSSGWSEIWGNDLILSLGNFQSGVGSVDEQEGAIMHELGHNLGLNHGGASDPTNCKPNYLSVMNYKYLFQENGDICRPLDYSNTQLSNLNEGSLTDSNIGSYPYPSGNPSCSGERKIFWSDPTGATLSSTTGVTNDWDNNGVDTNTYSQILNNLGASCGASTTPIMLTGFNDWNFINNGNAAMNLPEPMNFRPSSNFVQTNLQGEINEIGTGDNHADVPLTPPVVCTPPQVLQNGVCITPPVICTPPQVLQNGVCVTPSGMLYVIAGYGLAIVFGVIISVIAALYRKT